MRKIKESTILVHAASWLLFFSLVIAFLDTSGPDFGHERMYYEPLLLFFGIYVAIFYLNGEVLIPKLYLQKKYTLYVLCILALLAIVYFIHPFERVIHPGDGMGLKPVDEFADEFRNHRPPRRGPRTDIVSLILFMMIWSLSTALQIIRQWRNTEKKAAQAEVDRAKAELSFLKAQVNPHFLFNTMNNIYSMSVAKNENTPAAILKLSNIMRYVTDEAPEQFVPLENEIRFINDYVDLQRLRLNDKTTVQFSLEGPIQNRQIAPLILASFIENLFKYGVSNHEASTILINIRIQDGRLFFHSSNRIFQTVSEGRTGVGITNTIQRLQYLYPDKHQLSITKENGNFIVDLEIVLE